MAVTIYAAAQGSPTAVPSNRYNHQTDTTNGATYSQHSHDTQNLERHCTLQKCDKLQMWSSKQPQLRIECTLQNHTRNHILSGTASAAWTAQRAGQVCERPSADTTG